MPQHGGITAVVELLLYVDRFQSIDLPADGLYALTFEVGHRSDGNGNDGSQGGGMTSSAAGHFSVPARDDREFSISLRHKRIKAKVHKGARGPLYYTPAFVLAYEQEEVEIRDAVALSLEVPLAALTTPISILPLSLYVSVLFTDDTSCESHSDMRVVARTEFCLHHLLPSCSSFCRCVLPGLYFCHIDVTLHTTIRTFHFNAIPLPIIGEDLPLFATQKSRSDSNHHIVSRQLLDAMLDSCVEAHDHLRGVARDVILGSFSENQQKRLDELARCPIQPPMRQEVFNEEKFRTSLERLHDDVLRLWTTLISILSRTAAKQCDILRLGSTKGFSKVWNTLTVRQSRLIDVRNPVVHGTAAPPRSTAAQAADLRSSAVTQWEFRSHLPNILHTDVAGTPDGSHVFFETVCHWSTGRLGVQAWEMTHPRRKERKHLLQCRHQPRNEPAKAVPAPVEHLIVLVHGMDASSLDIRRLKNYMLSHGILAHYLLATSLESSTHTTIAQQSVLLAKEVAEFIEKRFHRIPHISFVGHSLGSLIVRAAIAEAALAPYQDFLHTFISLSSPHLGVLFLDSSLISSGLNLFRMWMSSQSLAELQLMDNPSLGKTLLYRLSSSSALGSFKTVILVGSGQDKFVPLHSAVLEPCKEPQTEKGNVHMRMLRNLNSVLKNSNCQVVKVDVNFCSSTPGAVQALLGSNVHAMALSDASFITMFLDAYKGYLVPEAPSVRTVSEVQEGFTPATTVSNMFL